MMLTGKTVDARRAKRIGPRRPGGAAAHPREHRAHGDAGGEGAAKPLPFCERMMLACGCAASSPRRRSKQVAKRARREHYPAPYAILELWRKYDGDPFARRRTIRRARSRRCSRTRPTRNLIRIFFLQERHEGARQGRGLPGRGTCTWSAPASWAATSPRSARMRGLTVTLQDTAPERIAPAVKRAAELFKRRLRDPRRVRDALDRLIPDVAGRRRARSADVIIEAIFENLRGQARAVREARGDGQARRGPRHQHLEPQARRHRRRAQGSRRGWSASTSSTRCRRCSWSRSSRAQAHDPEFAQQGRGLRAPDRQAAAAGEGLARVPRQPRARPLHAERLPHARRGHEARDASTRRWRSSACRWARSSSPTRWASTSASPPARRSRRRRERAEAPEMLLEQGRARATWARRPARASTATRTARR